MKKIITVFCILSAFVINAFSQSMDIVEAGDELQYKNNEVTLSYGAPSIISLGGSVFIAMFSLGNVIPEISNGTITAGYNYYFDENWALGGTVTYEKLYGLNTFSGMVKGTAQYGWKHFKFYHTLGVGALIGIGSPAFVFDIVPIGLKADFEDFSIFLESSIISTGIIKFGGSYKF